MADRLPMVLFIVNINSFCIYVQYIHRRQQKKRSAHSRTVFLLMISYYTNKNNYLSTRYQIPKYEGTIVLYVRTTQVRTVLLHPAVPQTRATFSYLVHTSYGHTSKYFTSTYIMHYTEVHPMSLGRTKTTHQHHIHESVQHCSWFRSNSHLPSNQ